MAVMPLKKSSRLTVSQEASVAAGKVVLVGAGPGDPELLTLKALRAIESADVILYDRLVSAEICALFPASTPAFYVGKAKDNHSIPQAELNQLLVSKAQQGLNVCRLKGGDSFVFGRGGEEMLVLKQAGIHVEVVPGITAGAGATSYAGIPLTHRGLAQGCSFITAHGEKELDIHWPSLVASKHTLVFYMGLSRAAMIREQLLAAGMASEMPVALIENGCCVQQRVVQGQLSELELLVEREQVQSPALIVVGKVVSLADQLAWFGEIQKQNQNAEMPMLRVMAQA